MPLKDKEARKEYKRKWDAENGRIKYQEKMQDPEFVAKKNVSNRKSRAKVKADPEGYKHVQELKRLQHERRKTTDIYKFTKFIEKAEKRGSVVELSLEQFLDIIKQPCHYCGKESSFGNDEVLPNDQATIDHKDNDIRVYNLDNCVPSCHKCNNMKGISRYDAFMQLIKQFGSVDAVYKARRGLIEG